MEQFSIYVDYPKQAYIVYLLIMRENNLNTFFPLNELFTTFNAIENKSKKFIQKTESKDIYIPPAPIVFPIQLMSKVSLRNEFWDEPTQELSGVDRVNNFLKPLENFRYYKVLVSPILTGRVIKPWVTYCFNLNARDEEIDFFMTNTYLSMDIRAKYAAFYRFGNPVRYELKTKKKVLIKNAALSSAKN